MVVTLGLATAASTADTAIQKFRCGDPWSYDPTTYVLRTTTIIVSKGEIIDIMKKVK